MIIFHFIPGLILRQRNLWPSLVTLIGAPKSFTILLICAYLELIFEPQQDLEIYIYTNHFLLSVFFHKSFCLLKINIRICLRTNYRSNVVVNGFCILGQYTHEAQHNWQCARFHIWLVCYTFFRSRTTKKHIYVLETRSFFTNSDENTTWALSQYQ